MTHLTRSLTVAAVAGALAAAPGSALAQGQDGPGGRHAGAGRIPARVALRIRKAERALQRAEDADTPAAAVTALGSAQTFMAAALKAAAKHPSPGAFGAVARVQDDVAQSAAGLLDGAGDDLTTAAAAALKAALDGHDAVLADIGALSDASPYARVYDEIANQADDEVSSFTDGLADDTLTDAGKQAEQDAVTQATATGKAASAAADAADTSDTSDGADYPGSGDGAGDPGDCPHGGGF